jgi:hypothetical protein
MYRQVFSTPVAYRAVDDPSLGSGPATTDLYYSYPGSFAYGEVFHSFAGLLVNRETTPTSSFTIILAMNVRSIYDVFHGVTQKFDGVTGAPMGVIPAILNDTPGFIVNEIVQSVGGSTFATTGSYIFEVNPTTPVPPPFGEWTPSSFFEIPSDQSFHGISSPMVDRANDLIVMSATPADVDGRYILVNRLSTGALIRRIWVSGSVTQIIQEDDRRCFVICSNGAIDVVDYTTGQILGVTRAPGAQSGSAILGTTFFAWVTSLRRLIAFNFLDAGRAFNGGPPYNVDGSSPNTLTGFYPVPIAVSLTKPIPLKPLRKDRNVQVLCRVVGDAAEAIPSIRVTATTDGEGVLVPSSQTTDSDGYALILVKGNNEGSTNLSLSADI